MLQWDPAVWEGRRFCNMANNRYQSFGTNTEISALFLISFCSPLFVTNICTHISSTRLILSQINFQTQNYRGIQISEQVILCFLLLCKYSLLRCEAVHNVRQYIVLGTLQCFGETCRFCLQVGGVSRFFKMSEDSILHRHIRGITIMFANSLR